MRTTRGSATAALLAAAVGIVLLGAGPASADVDCVDLGSREAAQTYLEGRPGDLDGLDADGDGQACEGADDSGTGTWVLVGFAVLLAGGLLRYSRFERQPEAVEAAVATGSPLPLVPVRETVVRVPRQATGDETVPESRPAEVVASSGRDSATGSFSELARALRVVPYGKRMALLEEYAAARGAVPRDLLDELAGHTSDLELQGWALAGYDPPWTVRLRRCSCVDAMRNFRLQTAEGGTHYWACASCHASDRQPS